jgi:DNA-binding beta-propeller fold protein YncE
VTCRQKWCSTPRADGNTLYIANEADRSEGYVQFWNLITGTQIGTNLPLTGAAGYGIAIRPTTGLLYVTTAIPEGRIYVIDPGTRRVLKSAVAGGLAREVVFAPNGVGFVPNGSDWVDFIK